MTAAPEQVLGGGFLFLEEGKEPLVYSRQVSPPWDSSMLTWFLVFLPSFLCNYAISLMCLSR